MSKHVSDLQKANDCRNQADAEYKRAGYELSNAREALKTCKQNMKHHRKESRRTMRMYLDLLAGKQC